MGKVHVGAFVEDELASRLEAVARQRSLSRSDVMREMLNRGLADYEAEQEILRIQREAKTETAA